MLPPSFNLNNTGNISMTVRMVAPESDMLSAVVHGLQYEIKKNDRFGRVVDVNDVHVPDFRAMGFKTPEELDPSAPIELVTKSGPTQEELDELQREQDALVSKPRPQDLVVKAVAKALADEEAAKASAIAKDKQYDADRKAEEEAAEKAAEDKSHEHAKKGKHK